jgi:predicted nucleotidyltransferase
MNTAVSKIHETIKPVLEKYGVRRAAIFGSAVRGEDTAGSDIDILVELGSEKTLLDLVGLKLELEEKLGRPVDVLTYSAVHPLLRATIEKEKVEL